MTFLMRLQPGFMGMAHGSEPHHRTHDLTYGFLFTTAVVGMLAQLRRPPKKKRRRYVDGADSLGRTAAGRSPLYRRGRNTVRRAPFGAEGTVIAALLHPAGRDFFRSFKVSRVNWVMLALVVIAAVPLLAIASTNIGLQRTATDEHSRPRPLRIPGVFSFTVIGVGGAS